MAEMMVFCEKDEVAYELLSAGRDLSRILGLGLSAAILGRGVKERAGRYFSYGAKRVYLTEIGHDMDVEVCSEALQKMAEQAEARVILVGCSKMGKELASRLAQRLGAGCIIGVIGLRVEDGVLVASRYALGGNTVAEERVTTACQVIAVMPRTFGAVPENGMKGEVVEVDMTLPEPRVKVVERRPKTTEAVNIEEAKALVCVGRGLAKKEDLALVQELAGLLRAEVGCTRSLASDYHWLSEERMVGLSGKKGSPELYVGIGLSGQIQHTVGIMGAKTIVAINRDKEAPIFKMADYGMVGDLYQIVPLLNERLKTRGLVRS